MEFRSQTAIVVVYLALGAAAWAQPAVEVRHDHLLRDKTGTLRFDQAGVAFEKSGGKPDQSHPARWDYVDIRQIELRQERIILLLYSDRSPWLLGVDKEYEFPLAKGQDVRPVYEYLKDKLSQRLVADLADSSVPVLWEVPVKRLGTFRGSHGRLRVGPDHIVYETGRKNASRTWRMEDIETVSSSGPRQLTITTHERAITHYGSRKDFNFQLKEPIDERRYNLLWRRLNGGKLHAYLTAAK
jgi:hypothetical protein